MGCTIQYDCVCACASVTGKVKIGGEEWGSAADPDTVRGPGQASLVSTSSDDPNCDCLYGGTTYFYQYVDDGKGGTRPHFENPSSVSITVRVHDNDCLYVEVDVQGVIFRGIMCDTVGWTDNRNCETQDPPLSASTWGNPSGSVHLVREDMPDDDGCNGLSFSMGGTECCKEMCITKQYVDENGTPHMNCVDHPRCSTTELQPWPWARESTKKLKPTEWFDDDYEMPVYLHTYPSDEAVWNPSDIPGYCDLDCCSALTGAFTSGTSNNVWANPEEYWSVTGGGWSQNITDLAENHTRWCFNWCQKTYYQQLPDGDTPESAGKLPVMTFTPPCSGFSCLVYGVTGEDESAIANLSGECGSNGGGSADSLTFKVVRSRFKPSSSETGKRVCDESGVIAVETYEHVCASNVTPTIPCPTIHSGDYCGGYYCVKKSPGCSDNQCMLKVTMSWSGGPECKTIAGSVWVRNETRNICSSSWNIQAKTCASSFGPSGGTSGLYSGDKSTRGSENMEFDASGNHIGFIAKEAAGNWVVMGDKNGNVTATNFFPDRFEKVVVPGCGGGHFRSGFSWYVPGDCGPSEQGNQYGHSNGYRTISGCVTAHQGKIAWIKQHVVPAVSGSVSFQNDNDKVTMSWHDLIKGDTKPMPT